MNPREVELYYRLRDAGKEEERVTGIRPRIFFEMLGSLGPVQTVLQLIRARDPSDGFRRLLEARRLDLTVESIAQDFPDLISPADLSRARIRLAETEQASEML